MANYFCDWWNFYSGKKAEKMALLNTWHIIEAKIKQIYICMYVHMSIHTKSFVHVCIDLTENRSNFFQYTCLGVCVYIYIYIYIQ